MRCPGALLLLALLLLAATWTVPSAAQAQDTAPVITLSGSGTTNPSKLLWRVLDMVEQRAGTPVRATYRAVGSGTGIEEFLGDEASNFAPYSSFGSADVPLSSEQHALLQTRNTPALQLPFVLGGVSIFATTPAGAKLQLSPCTLAKIFKGEITEWDHEDILADNPELNVDPGAPITVISRSDSSSSTAGVTEYLYKACPDVWGDDLVGKTINWPEGTITASGSGGVTDAILGTSLGITYLSSSHGHDAGLPEVAIQNLDGNFLTWLNADLGAALLEVEDLPDDYTQDMSAVDLIHLGGASTWPITQLSYLFIRIDQTASTQSGPLLKAVATMLFSSEVQNELFAEYGFSPLPESAINTAISNLNSINLAPGAQEWLIEGSSTVPNAGNNATTLSVKRKSWMEEQVVSLASDLGNINSALGNHLGRQVHGSGTTNPSGLFWQVMETMESQASRPVEITYRAVGSSTGQYEFIGAANDYMPYNDFGSGDLPLSGDQYEELTAAGHTVMQFPVLIGAVGVFHNIPEDIVGSNGLKLDSCVLAKIFQANITSWDHSDILALNPQMDGKVSSSDKITIFHRSLGSSSTSGFTEYLNASCPSDWVLGAGKTLDNWPADAVAVQGSGGMVAAIAATPFGIGYVDSGQGWNQNLEEVALKNKVGTYVTTKSADVPAAAQAAIQAGSIPESSTSDFSGVSLIDQSGDNTWPITFFSYVYVRQNLGFLGTSAGVLKAFLQYLFSPAVHSMLSVHGFFPLPEEMEEINNRGIEELILPAGTETWMFEDADNTQKGVGSGTFVFSAKRHAFTAYESELLAKQVTALAETSSTAGEGLTKLQEQNDQLRVLVIVSLVLGGISLLFCVLLAILVMCRLGKASSSGGPCADPNMSHIPMKEYASGEVNGNGAHNGSRA